jgi:hypothetical protein
MPKLEEALEKKKIMRTINYKDHLNKIFEGKLNIYRRKLLKETKKEE